MPIQENTIRRFFIGGLPPEALAIEASYSVAKIGGVDSEVMIEDMEEDFKVTRIHVLKLCDAGITHHLSAKALNAVAFALLASDRFELDSDDEVMMEVLNEWSAPEVNYPLTSQTLLMHRRWLSGEPLPPAKRSAAALGSNGRLISRRRKVRVIE
jgi:hypothetical protein